MLELYIIRHGETDTNKEARINGNSTNMPLNEKGRQQAQELKSSFDLSNFDEVISSPLKRAFETAQIITEGTGIEIKTDDRLREADYGSWDGKTEEELFAQHPDAFDINGFLTPEYVKYAQNAEDYEDVYKRVGEIINELQNAGGDKKIALVCHGFISRALMKVIVGADSISTIIQPKNCGVSKYQLNEDGTRNLIYYARIAPTNFD